MGIESRHFASHPDLDHAVEAAQVDVLFCDHGHARIVLLDARGQAIAYADFGHEEVRDMAKQFATEAAKHYRACSYKEEGHA